MTQKRFTSAMELCRELQIKLKPASYALLHPELTPEAYFERLLEKGHLPEARRVLAHAMPRQRALWWACLCVWHAHQGDPPVRLAAILDALLNFLADPSDERRRRLQALARRMKASSLEAALAHAAFFSGGSVSKPGLPAVQPRPFVTGRLVGVVVYLAAVKRHPAQYKKLLRHYL
ncbi:MAG: hypothetical protein AB7K24_33550, partial [Gemmataceae bacterium]